MATQGNGSHEQGVTGFESSGVESRQSTLLAQFDRLWSDPTAPPDLFAFLHSFEEVDAGDYLAVIQRDQERRWAVGQGRNVEWYLSRMRPDLVDDEMRFQLMRQEIGSRRTRGERLKQDEFRQRFPMFVGRMTGLLGESTSIPDGSVSTTVPPQAGEPVHGHASHQSGPQPSVHSPLPPASPGSNVTAKDSAPPSADSRRSDPHAVTSSDPAKYGGTAVPGAYASQSDPNGNRSGSSATGPAGIGSRPAGGSSAGESASGGRVPAPGSGSASGSGSAASGSGGSSVPSGPDPAGVLGLVLNQRYKVTRYLSGGGLGHVYQGRDLRFDRLGEAADSNLVAIKFTKSDNSREAHLMKQFRHPNFVQVYDYGQLQDGFYWLVMEFLSGRTLEKILDEQGGPLPLDLVMQFIEQVGPALQSAHNRQLVHRDLKPANIMLVKDTALGDESFKVLDFGLSAQIDAENSLLNKTLNFAGTLWYMSPEQVEGRDPSAQTDIYCLGGILYELLTHKSHLPNRKYTSAAIFFSAILTSTPASFADAAPGVKYPPGIEEVVLQCLAKNPQDRPASVREVRDRFVAAIEAAQRPPQRVRPAWQQQLLPLTLVVALFSLVSWLGYKVLTPPAPTVLPAPAPAATGSPAWLTRVSLHADRQQLQLSSGDEAVLALNLKSIPPDAVIDWQVTDESRKLTVTAVPDRSDSSRCQIRIRGEQSLLTWLQAAATISVGEEHSIRKEFRLPVSVVWLPRGFQPAPNAEVIAADGQLFYNLLRRTVGPETVDFLLIPSNSGCEPVKTFYIMKQKVCRSLFEEFLRTDPEGISEETKSFAKQGWKVRSELDGPVTADKEHPHWPATNLLVEEADAFAVWMSGDLPNASQWDRASGQEFSVSQGGKCVPPREWVPEIWAVGPYRSSWQEGDKAGIALDAFHDIGSSPMDMSCFGCRDMAGNGYEYLDDVISALGNDARVPVPPERQSPALSVRLRGWPIGSRKPLRYDDPQSSQAYAERAEYTGFRIVINVP